MVQTGTRILLGSGLEKIYFIIWQRTRLHLVYLCPENFRVPKFENNRLNCLRENVKNCSGVHTVCMVISYCSYSDFQPESNKWNKKV